MSEVGLFSLLAACLLGLATTSSSLIGAALGLYARLSERGLACVLGFAAGALISALAIELAFESAETLHARGFGTQAAWAFVGGGFAIGALIIIPRRCSSKGEAPPSAIGPAFANLPSNANARMRAN